MHTPERLHTIVAVHLFLVCGDEILLLRRFNTGYEDGNYSLPTNVIPYIRTAIDAWRSGSWFTSHGFEPT